MRLTAAMVVMLVACGPEGTYSSGGGGGGGKTFTLTPVDHPRALEITGGTVAISANGRLAAVSDADHDRVLLVDLQPLKVRARVAVLPGSHPGRLAFDPNGDVYVALRATGEVAKIDPTREEIVSTRTVCDDPRGIVWDGKSEVMRVACANGELAALAPTGPVTKQRVATDLRDVLLTPQGLRVTTFRSAQLIDPSAGSSRFSPPDAVVSNGATPVRFTARVAWRSGTTPDGTVVMAHQNQIDGPIEDAAPKTEAAATGAAYGSPPTANCQTPVVRSVITVIPPAGQATTLDLGGALPVDLSVSPDGKEVAVALAGRHVVDRLRLDVKHAEFGLCAPEPAIDAIEVTGTPVGVAHTPEGGLLVHSRAPDELTLLRGAAEIHRLPLGPAAVTDPGQGFFHTPVNGVACVSCHPEGRDDGHVWNVKGARRRTPSLASGLLETAPFHWQGELIDMGEVVHDTFVTRMGGSQPDVSTVNELANWIEGIPRPASTGDVSVPHLKLIEKGRRLFESEAVGCTQCHTGETLSTASTLDVGTGGKFQVPSLRGVGSRGPWLHDGRAATLRDRFIQSPGGRDKHGATSKLSAPQLDQLTAYLESL